jgi:hypothetical protein
MRRLGPTPRTSPKTVAEAMSADTASVTVIDPYRPQAHGFQPHGCQPQP